MTILSNHHKENVPVYLFVIIAGLLILYMLKN